METKFTKGKWKVRKSILGIDIHTDNDKSFGIVDFGSYEQLENADYPKEEAEANALLISKAPEMFDCLLEIVCAFENNSLTNIDYAKQILKEATEL